MAIKLSAANADKLRRTVTGYLHGTADLTGQTTDLQTHGDTITAKLTSRDTVDTSQYAWTEAQRSGSGWDDLTSATGLVGTLTENVAIDIRVQGLRFDLTNAYVVMTRGVRKKSVDDGEGGTDTELENVWFIVGYPPARGMYEYMVDQNLTDITVGYAPEKAHPPYE